MATAELKVRIDAETGQLKRGLDKADRDLKGFGQSATKSVTSFGNATTGVFKLAAASIAGALSVGAFTTFGRDVLNATAQFEKFGAVLGNTLGSSALANLKLKEIQEFAAKTPFGVNELTNSFVKLANQGFKPTGDQMRKLGDLAASTGKSFDQLSEAILDAQTGEFERLKEFGIRAQDSGNKVIFTFKGVQTTVDKSSESIRNYITDLGKAEGVSGSMSVISETLTGKISNLGDSWDQMLISVGSNTSGVFSGAISIISDAINSITEFNNELNIASKFKIEGGLFQQLAKFAGRGAGVGGLGAIFTTKDLKVEAIQSVESGVNSIVSATISGAKSATEFGNAIAKLKAEGDKLLQSKGGGDKNVANAFKTIYQDGIKALQDGRKAFQAELNKPAGANFGKGAKEKIDKAEFERGEKISIQRLNSLDTFLAKYRATESEINKIPLIGFPEDINTKLAAPLDNLKLNLLPQLQGSFQTFFDEILIRGKLSFDSLGKSILNTFASVLANQATTGVLALLGDKDSKAKGNIFATILKGGKKGGGLLGLLGIGGKVAAGAAATTGAAATGGTAALGSATAASGGLLLPILGGIAAVAGIASLFKKRKSEPQPAFTTSNAISTSSSSNVDFGSGRVVFEISGTNLVGVLNRAGAKLQRFGP